MSSYLNERRRYVPVVGDEVVLAGRFDGKFSVEEVNTEEKTAVLRHMHPSALVKGAMWTTMYLLKHLAKLYEAITATENGELEQVSAVKVIAPYCVPHPLDTREAFHG